MSDDAEGLTKPTKKTRRKSLNDEAESDSVDSPICTYESPMPMRDPLSETQGSALRLSPED
jgi:hypothetical protein